MLLFIFALKVFVGGYKAQQSVAAIAARNQAMGVRAGFRGPHPTGPRGSHPGGPRGPHPAQANRFKVPIIDRAANRASLLAGRLNPGVKISIINS